MTDVDLYLFGEGTQRRAQDKLGANKTTLSNPDGTGVAGVHFAVWAPNADAASVIGDFNGWNARAHVMRALDASGVWEVFVPGARDGEKYKFEIRAKSGEILQKSDPYGVAFEVPPSSASIVYDLSKYVWRDHEWMTQRPAHGGWLDRPMAVYEAHLGSWARVPEEGNRFLPYR